MSVHCSRSSIRRVSRVLVLAVGAAAALACSGKGSGLAGSPGTGAHPTAPVLANLVLWPSNAARGDGGGSVMVDLSAEVMDAGADVAKIAVALYDADGGVISADTFDIQNPPGMMSGTVRGQVAVSTAVIADYTIRVSVADSGGSASNTLDSVFSVIAGNPTPAIDALSPDSAQAGSSSLSLTVTGSGFVASSTVAWNGMMLPTTFVDVSTLVASVPQYDLYQAGTAQITVFSPPPGGGTSNPATFTVTTPPPNPVPTISSLSPSSVAAGTGPFTLTVTGSGFTARSSVTWNYSYLSATLVDSSTLQVVVPSSYFSSVGTVQVSVTNPSPGGGTSGTLPFAVTRPALPGVTVVELAASDLAWDPYQRKIYAAVPSSSAAGPNTIAVLDPYTGELTAYHDAGSDPRTLAISDDGAYLYAGLGGASFVRRFALPSLALDLEIPLGLDPANGPYYARDVQVAPEAARTIAVSLAVTGSYGPYQGRITVFDDATPRTTSAKDPSNRYGPLQWGADASTLYACNESYSSYSSHLYAFSVDALARDYVNSLSCAARIHFDAGTGLVYGDDGRAVQPTSGMVEGTFVSGLGMYSATTMVPDSSLGEAFFAGQPSFGGWVTLRSFDLTSYAATQSTTLSYVGGYSNQASRLIRWGMDGVAFIVGSEIVLVRGAAVLPPSPTPNAAPVLDAVSPASAASGRGNFRLTVTGSGFVPGSVVRWNGTDRTTRRVSPTALVAFIPASDVAGPGTATIDVTTPEPGGGVSGTVTFDVAP